MDKLFTQTILTSARQLLLFIFIEAYYVDCCITRCCHYFCCSCRRSSSTLPRPLYLLRQTKNKIKMAVGLLKVKNSEGGINPASDNMWLVVVFPPLVAFNCTSTPHYWHGARELRQWSPTWMTVLAIILILRRRHPVTSCCRWCEASRGWFWTSSSLQNTAETHK